MLRAAMGLSAALRGQRRAPTSTRQRTPMALFRAGFNGERD
jgi:hypothetical protein